MPTRKEPYQHMKQGQFQLAVRTFIPFKAFLGFEGDNRGFSTSRYVGYRSGMFVVFDLRDGQITERLVGGTTGSRQLTLPERLGVPGSAGQTKRTVAKFFAKVKVRMTHKRGDVGRISFQATMAASDPIPPYSLVSPNIDTWIAFTAFLYDGNLFVAGRVIGDRFPSTEVIVRDHTRSGRMLLRYKTPLKKWGAVSLMGEGTRTLGTFKQGIQLDEQSCFMGSAAWPSGA